MTWTAELARPFGVGGETTRAHLEAVATRMKGAAAEDARAKLTPPPMPPELAYLWEWWIELHAARPESAHGIAPFTYGELAAWSRLTGVEPTAWETATLLTLDRVYRTTIQAEA
jgi:hypothetical protein